MNRRDFIGSAGLGSLGALSLGGMVACHAPQQILQPAAPQQPESPQLTGLELLDKPYNSKDVLPYYEVGIKTAAATVPVPNGILLYDKQQMKFVRPSTLKLTRPKGSYNITATLRSVNVSSQVTTSMHNNQQDIQLGLNFNAPIVQGGDDFVWVVKNALNIFLGKSSDISGSVASFSSTNAPNTQATSPSSKIQVLQGSFDLTVNAYYQKKNGFWRKLFQTLSKVPGEPLLATLGIPGIALSGLQFVAYSLDKLTQNEPLVPIWDPRPLPFALIQGVDRDFYFKEGLWCILDREIMNSTNFLQGYTIDIDGESYQVIDSSKTGLNANYVVANFAIDPIT